MSTKTETITRIAREVLELPTLTERGRDMLDYRDPHVNRIATALGRAYDAGRVSIISPAPARPGDRPATHAECVALETVANRLACGATRLYLLIRHDYTVDRTREAALGISRELAGLVAILDSLNGPES